MPDRNSETTGNKLLGLELVRFAAAFGILFWHYQHFAFAADIPADIFRLRQPFYPLLRAFYDYGADGVKVFWCVSGFIFFWKYREAVADRLVDGKNFFVLRFSRLYPLHAVTLLFAASLQFAYFKLHGYFFVYQNNDLFHFLLQLFMGSDWGFQKGMSYNGPIWSISVEVLVYVCFFLVLRYLSRAAWVNMVIIAACAAARMSGVSSPVIDAAALFYLGGLAAMARRTLQVHKRPHKLVLAAWGVLCSAPFAVPVFKACHLDPDLYILVYAPILVFCVSGPVRVSPSAAKFIEAAGNMTYSSYLLHFPIQLCLVLACSAAKTAIPVFSPFFLAVYLATTLAAAYLAYRYFEAPAQNFIRHKFSPRRG